MITLTELKEWQALVSHQHEIANQHMRVWFDEDVQRLSRFSLSCGELFLDYSRNRITPHTLNLLIQLADSLQLRQKIENLFTGHPINITENRPALHTALRDKSKIATWVNGSDVAAAITEAQEKIRLFVDSIHSKTWRGMTGKPISHVVNIGIGGSHTGPMMCAQALKDFAISPITFHFIASVDKNHLDEVLNKIDAESTLFIISSKSFSTLETMTNAHSVAAWLEHRLGPTAIQHHFVAVTAVESKALAFGIRKENIFALWDWVGGRYSIWSSIGLPLMLMIGNEGFDHFLDGAYEMDQHFRYADFAHNMPVLLALLGIWYINFFNTNVQAIIPYSHQLRHFISYLQQAEMESNGKSIGLTGNALPYTTSPVLFGEEGAVGQHAYHQLLHQGQHLIPVDFLLVGKAPPTNTHHDILIASALSQAQALMRGKTYDEALHDLLKTHPEKEARALANHQVIAGNKPSNIIFIKSMTPKNLGALISLYEHKIFIQGVIWDINSFDQWGIELGKQLLPNILRQIQSQPSDQPIDSAITNWINYIEEEVIE